MQDRRGGIQAIARAAAVLRALEAAPDGAPLTELAAAVQLPKSTVHRLVAALAEEGLVATGADGRIRLGRGLARLGAAARDTLRHDLRPILAELHETTDETVDLAVLDGGAARFVDQLASPHRLRAVSAVGESFPLHSTANGKALLAALPEPQALDLLPTRLRTRALRDELAAVRATGVAYDRDEHTEGISAVGAAVLDAAGPVAAISIPVPTARFARNERRYATLVREAAARASALLASSP